MSTTPVGQDLVLLARQLDSEWVVVGNVLSRVATLVLDVLHRSEERVLLGGTLLSEYRDRIGEGPRRPLVLTPDEAASIDCAGPVLRVLRLIGLRRALPVQVLVDPSVGWVCQWSPRRDNWQITSLGGPVGGYSNVGSFVEMLSVGLIDLDEQRLAAIAPLRSWLVDDRLGHPLTSHDLDQVALLAQGAVASYHARRTT